MSGVSDEVFMSVIAMSSTASSYFSNCMIKHYICEPVFHQENNNTNVPIFAEGYCKQQQINSW